MKLLFPIILFAFFILLPRDSEAADFCCTCAQASNPSCTSPPPAQQTISDTPENAESRCDERCSTTSLNPVCGSARAGQCTVTTAPPQSTVVGFGANPLCPGTAECNIPSIIGRIIRIVLGVVGSLALVMFVYGGFLWMTARGNTDRTKEARNILVWTSLGLVAIFGAYMAIDFVIRNIRS